MSKNKRNTTSVVIIVITLMLICAIGVSFAYFINKIQIKGENKSTTRINTSTIASVEYTSNSDIGSNSIVIDNAYPGKFGYVEFTLTATTKDESASTYYQIVWNIDQNEFNYLDASTGEVCDGDNCEAQVYYALYDGKVNISKSPYTDPAGNSYDIFKGVADGNVITYNSQAIKNDVTKKTGQIILDVGKISATKNNPTSKTYTLVVWFEETGHNQNNNQGKMLNGKIDVNLSDKSFE